MVNQANITTSVRKPSPVVSIIDIQGDVTGFAENALMDAFSEASNDGVKMVLLNLTDLDYMNSSGIGLLVTLLIRTQRQNQRLMAYGLSQHYQEIFKLTRLDEAIGIYADETVAMAAV